MANSSFTTRILGPAAAARAGAAAANYQQRAGQRPETVGSSSAPSDNDISRMSRIGEMQGARGDGMDAADTADVATDVGARSEFGSVQAPAVRVGIQSGSASGPAVRVRIEHREGNSVDDDSDVWILDKEFEVPHASCRRS